MSTDVELIIVDKANGLVVYARDVGSRDTKLAIEEVRIKKTADVDCETHLTYQVNLAQADLIMQTNNAGIQDMEIVQLKRMFGDRKRYVWQFLVS